MARWHGRVGYITTVETEPGIWEAKPVERTYSGDILSTSSRWSSSNQVNDNLNVSNRISILADSFAYQNFSKIKYVEFMDELWCVTNTEVQHPRLILTVGGVYNDKQT